MHPRPGLGFADTYVVQAATYDRTRSAGTETLGPLLDALAKSPEGCRVLDVGGGTGNYAKAFRDAGYQVTVLDRSPEMLGVAASKGLRVMQADAAALPVRSESVGAVTMVSMLHQVPDWRGAVREAQRVVVPGGVVALVLYTAEHIRDHYFLDYFPSSRAWADHDHRPLADYRLALPGAHAIPLHIRGTDDLTMQIMRRHPQLALDDRFAAQTSYFARLAAEDPTGLAEGRAKLARDLTARRLPANYKDDLPQGDATLLEWRKGL